MSHDGWKIEPFDKQRHHRAGFDCGNAVLNDWLATKITQFERRDLARTYVLVQQGQRTIRGYYAISNHMVAFEALPEDQAKGLPQIDMAVVLIGRMAVDVAVQGEGMGAFLLIDALRRCEYLASKIGIKAVQVDAIDDDAKSFYERYGFHSLLDDPRHLLLPVKLIRALELPPL